MSVENSMKEKKCPYSCLGWTPIVKDDQLGRSSANDSEEGVEKIKKYDCWRF